MHDRNRHNNKTGASEEVFLVTGSTGFLGSFLVPYLVSNSSSRIVVIVMEDLIPSWLADQERIDIIRGDLRDKTTWQQLPSSITHIFHLAANIERDSKKANNASLVYNNLLPIAHMIEHCKHWKCLKQIIYSSSISVFGNSNELLTEKSQVAPCDLYAASKLAGENLLSVLSNDGMSVSCLRYTSLYGTGMCPETVLPKMIQKVVKGENIQVYGEGARIQNFLHAHDAAQANFCAYKKNAHGVFNIGSSAPVSMKQLAELVTKIYSDEKSNICFLHDKSEGSGGYNVDISKACKELEYTPSYNLELGLTKMKHNWRDTSICP